MTRAPPTTPSQNGIRSPVRPAKAWPMAINWARRKLVSTTTKIAVDVLCRNRLSGKRKRRKSPGVTNFCCRETTNSRGAKSR